MTRITFLGAAGTITGSRHLVDTGRVRVLVDCGLFHGPKELTRRNHEPFPVEPSTLDFVVLTHAHIDHTGYLPRLLRDGFTGEVVATAATADLLKILLADAGHLQEEEARYRNRHRPRGAAPAAPLYTAAEGREAARRVRGCRYGEAVTLAPGLAVTFRRAGHILGSASVTLELPAGRLVFSGDVGRYGAPVLPDPAPPGEADWIVVESTYGDREHDPTPIADQLERVVRAAAERGGALLVPAFAVGRTQELMYHLSLLEHAGRVPVLPAYVDSPMAVNATEIYCAHPEDFEGDVRGMVMGRNCPLHCTDFRLARSAEESKAINRIEGPVIVVAASGMLAGGRILHHLRQRLPDPRTTLLFASYQAQGTRGRRLQEGARSVSVFGEDVPVRATVEAIHGLSAHADRTGLLRWLTGAPRPPRRVFVVHGEPGPAQALASLVRAELEWQIEVPELGESFELEAAP